MWLSTVLCQLTVYFLTFFKELCILVEIFISINEEINPYLFLPIIYQTQLKKIIQEFVNASQKDNSVRTRETNLVILLFAMELFAPPILAFIFKQSCARVMSLQDIACFAWMHWVESPFLLNICRAWWSAISKLPFSVSQILLRSATTKKQQKILISDT